MPLLVLNMNTAYPEEEEEEEEEGVKNQS